MSTTANATLNYIGTAGLSSEPVPLYNTIWIWAFRCILISGIITLFIMICCREAIYELFDLDENVLVEPTSVALRMDTPTGYGAVD